MSDKYDEMAREVFTSVTLASAMDNGKSRVIAQALRKCAAEAFREAGKMSDKQDEYEDGEPGPNMLGDELRARASALTTETKPNAIDSKSLKFFCNHGKIDCPKCVPLKTDQTTKGPK